ncbi:phospholipase B [Pleurotus eryngii]|uniref:Lysophospholipase n=1 Tax=Pleurotus eryngii TaxID=5323 RepID=A0A9P6DL81_PLEER|nr:phospholipase B [Pleurotus eryngii]
MSHQQSQGAVTDYSPQVGVQCPDVSINPLIRVFTPRNQSLHPREQEYIKGRQAVIEDAWADWLGDGSGVSYNVSAFAGHFPKVGMAIPGGGLRSAQYGAACLNGLDSRNERAKQAGTGGLLQVSSYLTGLSGGSWVTSSLVFNNWPTVEDLVFGDGKDLTGWLLDLSLATPDGVNILSDKNQEYYGSLLWSVMAKAQTGIDTSMTDPWSRMISFHFLNQTTRNNFFTNDSAHGAGQLFSKIPDIPAYQQHQMPFPILVADSRPVGSNLTTILGLDPVVYEITPLEFGSYDPNLSAMVNITYAGTHLTNGIPVNGSSCVTGFDQAGFMMGTSASLFNQLFDFARNTIAGFSDSDSAGLLYVLSRQLQEVRTRADDVANWPSPFNGLNPRTFEDSDATWLELLDGSSNQENIPYSPLFVRSRELDVIVTIEGSADDATAWPNGTGPIFSARRQSTILRASHQQFPPIPPTPDAFIETGVRARPTFFGCDPTQTPPEWPLMIYLPNAPPINGDDPVTNTATFTLSYTQKHQKLFFDQVFNLTTQGFTPNSQLPDPNFGVCLQCAAIDRARLKITPIPSRSAICTQCFQQYCFDPQNPPSKSALPGRKLAFVDPDPQGLTKVNGFLSSNMYKLIGGLAGLVGFLFVLILGLLWWRKRRERKTEYHQVSGLHDDDDAPWKRYSDSNTKTHEAYEMPEHRGSLVSR